MLKPGEECTAKIQFRPENCTPNINPQVEHTAKIHSEMTQGFNYKYMGDISNLNLCPGHKAPGGTHCQNTIILGFPGHFIFTCPVHI
jgi:hypothetical protein